MSELVTHPVSEAVTLSSFLDPGFKTMRLSVNMLVPMSASRAAQYALLPSLVSRATRQYPDYTSLSARLAELYGASLGSGVQKIGEFQRISLSVDGLASRYAFGGEDMFAELTDLFFSVLFDPLKDGEGLFPQESFVQEKRQQLEQKDAEFSDKMIFAHQRCRELLFEGRPAGIDRLGSREDIEALVRRDLTPAWEELLKKARFEIFVLGDCVPDLELLREKFRGLGTGQNLGPVPYSEPGSLRRVSEEHPVAQSKLVMACQVDAAPEERLLFGLTSAVLGEPTSSKLFQNVREKQGICYYCDSSFSWADGTLFIESGVETKELDRVEEAVSEQLALLQKGDITEDELRCAKLYLCNSMRTVEDSLHRMEGWYLGRTFDQPGQTPQQAIETLMAYTKEELAEAAKRLRPAVVYALKGVEP